MDKIGVRFHAIMACCETGTRTSFHLQSSYCTVQHVLGGREHLPLIGFFLFFVLFYGGGGGGGGGGGFGQVDENRAWQEQILAENSYLTSKDRRFGKKNNPLDQMEKEEDFLKEEDVGERGSGRGSGRGGQRRGGGEGGRREGGGLRGGGRMVGEVM